jgi:hypothetical protein
MVGGFLLPFVLSGVPGKLGTHPDLDARLPKLQNSPSLDDNEHANGLKAEELVRLCVTLVKSLSLSH